MKLDSYESESINVGIPLISIISINYNNCNGLKKTILSIDAIIDKIVNVEHLIIDGESKDDSCDFAYSKGYTRNETTSFSRKRIIVKSDINLWEAMFNGLINARGNYIHYIHSGDIVSSPVDLLIFYKNIQEKNVDVSVCDVGLLRGGIIKKYYHDGFNPKFVFNGLMPPHPGLVVKKTLLSNLDSFKNFDKSLPHDFWLCVKILKVKNINIFRFRKICVYMEPGGLSRGLIYSIKRIYRQYSVLKLENINVSIPKIILYKIIKIFKF